MTETADKPRKIGLQVKLAVLIMLYTLSGLSILSVLIFTRLKDLNTDREILNAELRFAQWQAFINSPAGKNTENPGEAPVSPNAGERYQKLVAGETAVLYDREGYKIRILKDSRVFLHPEVLTPALIKDGGRVKDESLELIVSEEYLGDPAYLYLIVPLSDSFSGLADVYFLILSAALVLTLLALILGFILHHLIVKPLLRITDATEQVAEGDYSDTEPVATGDEIEDLSRSFLHMTRQVREMHQIARDASPLTGLPGNNSIAGKIESCINEGSRSAVMYVDIDNFKAYNDLYGFEAGDRAILFTAETLGRCADLFPEHDIFVGHVGGDDFIAVMDEEILDEFAGLLCRDYDDNIQSLYDEEDVEQGGIRARDRQGNLRDFPFMSISIAGVSVTDGRFSHFSEVAAAAAEVKKAAKSEEGSSFVLDRRKGAPVRFERE